MERGREEEDANLRSFLQWAADLGISDTFSTATQTQNSACPLPCLGHSLIVSHFPEAGGRGLAAARDLRKGELILKVPKEALMTSESLMKKDEFLSKTIKNHSSLSSTQILAVALLNEVSKGKISWWYPYLKQIPSSYDMLSSFSPLEIQALQIDDAIWAAEKAVRKAELEWQEASLIIRELKLRPHLSTFKAWLWASGTISSRTMHITWDDAGCLCPVGDFFNYAAPGEEPYDSESLGTSVKGSSFCYNSYGDESTGKLAEEHYGTSAERLIDAGYEEDAAAYCFYARRNYKKGEQVLLSYGTYTNLELMEHYGFLLSENPNDKAFILLESDIYPLCSWPRELLYIHQDGNPSFALLSTLRLWATPGNQRKSNGHLACSGHLLSADNEMFAMKWLVKTCQRLLENLPTSMKEDELLGRIIERAEHFPMKLEERSSFSAQLLAFLESYGMMDGDIIVGKRKKSIYRLQSVVQLRLNYKRTLANCIRYCTELMDHLSH